MWWERYSIKLNVMYQTDFMLFFYITNVTIWHFVSLLGISDMKFSILTSFKSYFIEAWLFTVAKHF